jgi:hypothetical protein
MVVVEVLDRFLSRVKGEAVLDGARYTREARGAISSARSKACPPWCGVAPATSRPRSGWRGASCSIGARALPGRLPASTRWRL